MTEPKVTQNQLDLMRHTVGLDRGNKPYRNYFSADEGHDSLDDLNDLVDMGLMKKNKTGISPDIIFSLTDTGCYMLNINGIDSID